MVWTCPPPKKSWPSFPTRKFVFGIFHRKQSVGGLTVLFVLFIEFVVCWHYPPLHYATFHWFIHWQIFFWLILFVYLFACLHCWYISTANTITVLLCCFFFGVVHKNPRRYIRRTQSGETLDVPNRHLTARQFSPSLSSVSTLWTPQQPPPLLPFNSHCLNISNVNKRYSRAQQRQYWNTPHQQNSLDKAN